MKINMSEEQKKSIADRFMLGLFVWTMIGSIVLVMSWVGLYVESSKIFSIGMIIGGSMVLTGIGVFFSIGGAIWLDDLRR